MISRFIDRRGPRVDIMVSNITRPLRDTSRIHDYYTKSTLQPDRAYDIGGHSAHLDPLNPETDTSFN
jgi:hypothetical protein